MNEMKFDKIVARELDIVDKNGNPRITLRCETDHSRISLHGTPGKHQKGIDLTFDIDSGGMIIVYDGNSNFAVNISFDDNSGGEINVYGRKGHEEPPLRISHEDNNRNT